MAFFTNVVDLQAALSACLTVRDWEVLFEAPFAGKIYLRDFRLFVTIIDHYRQKTKHTHTHIYTKWRWKLYISSLFDYYKTVFSYLSRGNKKLLKSRTVSQLIMRVHEPKVAYK